MRVQRWLAQNLLNVPAPHAASAAFAPRNRLRDAAAHHAGCTWLVKMDVRNFFESITEHRVFKVFEDLGYGRLMSFELARLCTRLPQKPPLHTGKPYALPYRRLPEAHLPQGAPTSPMLANLAVRTLDERLQQLADRSGWTYTRYADDVAFSTFERSNRREAARIARSIGAEIHGFGLECNASKTTIVPPGARKVLLGVGVDKPDPKLTRAFKDNLETHLYALLSPRIGVRAHLARRGFSSAIGMRLHVAGLIAFAKQIDEVYANKLLEQFKTVDWGS